LLFGAPEVNQAFRLGHFPVQESTLRAIAACLKRIMPNMVNQPYLQIKRKRVWCFDHIRGPTMKSTLSADQIGELLKFPTTSVVNAGRILGLSRNVTYEAVKRGEIESLKYGKRIVVLTAPLRRKMSIEA